MPSANFSSESSSAKNLYIQTLRGLAIILVVAGHVIGSEGSGGMKVGEHSILRYLYFSTEYIRLPLFTVISGWVYSNKPVVPEFRIPFLRGKIRRLVIPMLVFSTLLFFSRYFIPGTNFKAEIKTFPSIFLFPYDIYWYLYSLFIIFVAMSFLDRASWFHNFSGWILTLLAATLVFFISGNWMVNVPNYFSFKGAIYLFPFFLLGVGAFRFGHVLFQPKISYLYGVAFVLLIGLQQMAWLGYASKFSRYSIPALAIGFTSVLLLLNLKAKSALLVWIGKYAYGIFLLHVFFAGSFRMTLLKAGIHHQWIIFGLTSFLALAFSILTEKLISRFPLLQSVFFGISLKRSRPVIVLKEKEIVAA